MSDREPDFADIAAEEIAAMLLTAQPHVAAIAAIIRRYAVEKPEPRAKLCAKCGGNGVVKVRDRDCKVIGTRVCPECDGRCWAGAPSPTRRDDDPCEGA